LGLQRTKPTRTRGRHALRTHTDERAIGLDEMSLIPFAHPEILDEQLSSSDLLTLDNFNFKSYRVEPYLPGVRACIAGRGTRWRRWGAARTQRASCRPCRFAQASHRQVLRRPSSDAGLRGQVVPAPASPPPADQTGRPPGRSRYILGSCCAEPSPSRASAPSARARSTSSPSSRPRTSAGRSSLPCTLSAVASEPHSARPPPGQPGHDDDRLN
jgi:hypothetical protein